MTSCTTSLWFFTFILCCHHASSIPVSRGAEEIHIVTTYLPNYAAVLISLGALLFLAYFISGCVCCPNKSIKALSYQNGFPVSRLNENNFENQTEITIFPPRSTVIDLQPVSQPFPGFDDKVTFEPLPDILPKKFTSGQSAACSSRPAHFSALLKSKVSLHDWFDDPNSNFPREQLQYLQEIGIGWFGRVVEGEASLICENEEKTAVIVKILREEASPSEHLHFLHEVRPFRDLKHSNIIKLLGRCLESDPFLLIMEHSISDLKTYLLKQDKRENFVKDGLMLQMISNISSGLRYMHDKGFCHMDLAAHNCFICNDNSVKIGDYGVSFDCWKGDYYCLGDIALPIRWYSPEILRCSETTIETKEITKEANVWAFGVVLWEIVELGKLPYGELSDEEVLQKVLIERSAQLSPPAFDMICKDELVLVMKECWKPKKYRPSMEKIESYISQLYNDRLSIKSKELSFEERWNSIQPKITEISSYTGTESSSFKFENDFSTRSDLQNYSSDNEILSSFEMSFDILPKSGFNAQLSPSLNVLNGSIDELTDNDVYINSISLSCGKYDADTLSNISDKDNFQMEDDKENTESKNIVSEQFSSGIRDLDIISASQHDSSKNIILQNSNSIPHDSEIISKDKEMLADRIFKDSQYLSKSSDLSNISVSSFSKSSNLSEHVEYASHDKSNEMSTNSDLNGNCDFYDTNVNKYDRAETVSETDKFLAQSDINEEFKDFCLINNVVNVCSGTTIKEEINIENEFPESNRRLSIVPDIIIHESPSFNAAESLEENNKSENDSSISENKNLNKSYRFVFKEISDKEDAELSHQNFKEEIAHDLTETLKKSDGSKPLTSTPVKSSSDSFSPNPNLINSDINENSLLNDVFSESNIPVAPSAFNIHSKILNNRENDFEDDCDIEIVSSPEKLNSFTDLDLSNKSSDLQNVDSYQETVNSTDLEHFTTAHSSLCLSKTDDDVKLKIDQNDVFENTCLTESNITLISVVNDRTSILTADSDKSNNSNTFYVSAGDNLTEKENSKAFSEVISPPNGYESKCNDENCLDISNDNDISFQEDSKISETVSPPQAFQDNGLSVDSFSESKTSFDQEFSTSAECGSSENLDQYLEDDHISQANISAAKLLETSFPDMESKSFTYETCADFSGNMRPKKNSFNLNISDKDKRYSKMYESECALEDHHRYNPYKNMKSSLPSYDQMVLEDLDTGEQTVINERYSVCDDYDNSAESDEILKINTETDEAIIVDSSEALIGFVPSRSIELLQEYDVLPPLNPTYTIDEEKESSDSMNIEAYNSASPSPAAMKYNSSPYESPEHAYPQPYRNFCLQNEIIEEEITDEIVSPSSFHSSSSYCSNEIFMDEEKMSQSSESAHHGEMYETSVLPSMDHLFVASDDGSKSDVSSSDCSPVQRNEILNMKYRTDAENNHISDDQEDVMHSFQPTQSIRWLSDDTLDVEREDRSPIIIEGREILAGDVIQTCELTAKDIANALSQLEAKSHLHGLTPNHLNVSQSPSPFSSVESSPCRDAVYTPDFESDSEETNSGTSCSSTSGSFECIHNKFKNTSDISKVPDETDKSASSREQSPMKIFSKTWDCHATPTRGVLVTPEKKFSSMRKSVSFHEEDPQIVFEYPPASDSSEDGYPSDDHEEFIQNIDYLKYADWDLQVCDVEDIEHEEVLEIEELDSEPYVRRPAYSRSSVGPLNRPMLYTLTSGFSDEDFDLSETTPPFPLNAPSNSPEEERETSMCGSKIKDLIESQLNDLIKKNNPTKTLEDNAHSQLTRLSSAKEGMSNTQASVQESIMGSVEIEDIVIDELLPESQNNEIATVQNETPNDDNSLNFSEDEEVIVEELELSDADSDSESFEYNKENKPILLETESTVCHNQELMHESLTEVLVPKTYENIMNNKIEASCDSNNVCIIQNFAGGNLVLDNLSKSVDNKEKYSDNVHCKKNNSCFLDNVTDLNENEMNENIVTENSGYSSEYDFVSRNESVSPELHENLAQEDFADNKDTFSVSDQVTLNPSYSEYSDLKFGVPVNPVHSVNFESEFIKQSENDTNEGTPVVKSIEINSYRETVSDSVVSSMVSAHSLSNMFERNLKTNDHSNTSNSITQTQNSTNENTEISIDICSKEDNDVCKTDYSAILLKEVDLREAVPQFDTSATESTESCVTDGYSESLVNESNAVSNQHINEEGNVGQNVTQSSCCSNGCITDLSEAFSPITENEVINLMSLEDNSLISSKEETSKLHTSLVDAEKIIKACASPSTKNQENSESSLNVPAIIVTPASESELDDELEEFLRDQLQHFHSEVSPQEDFTVTSAFSSKPFDDVFGSYISGDSTDYIEAFNFEFENENENFYENYGDDSPCSVEIDMHDRLYPNNGREHRSSSLPLMTENLSDDDSLTMKSDSSLVYDSSKGITRL